MKVSLVAPQDIGLMAGGLRTQIIETARQLPAFELEVDFFNAWNLYQEDSADLYHLFSANAATHHIASTLHKAGLPFVISPVIFSNHSPSFIKAARQLESWSRTLYSGIWTDYSVISECCRMSQYTLPNTRAEAELLQKGFDVDPQKLRVIPNGVESRFSRATPDAFKRQYKLDDFVLFVGTIGSRRKNVLRLVEALSDLDLPGIFIGKTLDDERGQQCRRKIEDHPEMHLLNPLDHEDPLLASAYAASRVFALPSYFETPGIAAMEAALAGSGIAITERGGTREYFGNHAYYLKPESVRSIREAVRQAWEQPPGEELKQHILNNFSWYRIAEQTATIYNNVIRDGS